MRRALELLAASGLGAAIALVVARGWHLADATPLPATTESTVVAAAVSADELREALEREATQREMLASEVELMRSVLEQIATSQATAASQEPSPLDAATSGPPSTSGNGPFEAARLAALGLPEDEIADLRASWDEAQLAKLELSDQATRQGWLMRPEHHQRSGQIESDMRAEIGEDAYDQILYATNQVNGAEVRQVMGDSVAFSAGLQPGDRVISYGGARVFKPADLRFATATGRRDEQVVVQLERGEEILSVNVPRGPLGIVVEPVIRVPR